MEKFDVKITGKYRGFRIGYSEFNQEWKLYDGQSKTNIEMYGNTDLNKVKQYADRFLKSTFIAIKALHDTYDTYEEVTITSIDSDEGEAWIRDSKGRRNKVDISRLYAMTPENQTIIVDMRTIDYDIEKLEKTKTRLERKLQRLVIKK